LSYLKLHGLIKIITLANSFSLALSEWKKKLKSFNVS
jgi:hypothetical protein